MTPETPGQRKTRHSQEPDKLLDFPTPGMHHSVILVADDDVLVRNQVSLLMQQDGHFVLSAANGQEGLELSRQYPDTIDLAITDVEMPGLHGADLCGHLLEERPGIRLLLVSSTNISEIGRQNADSLFLRKPFDGQTLTARVRAILATPRLVDDSIRLLSQLRSELKQIDKEILSLEQPETRRRKTGTRSANKDPDVTS